MFTHIKKRDGRLEVFEARKIVDAIKKAGEATGEVDAAIAQRLSAKVIAQVKQGYDEPSIEDIQNTVEEVLMASPHRATARAYIIYRDQHARLRDLMTGSQVDLLEQYLHCEDWQVNENSNMGYSLQGLNNYIASEVSKVYWLNEVYPEHIRDEHKGGAMHIHDLGQLSVYCVGWDLRDLLTSGFKGAAGKVESAPAKHFRSALGQIVNFFYTLQGESAGAQAFANFDTFLAPFIRADGLSVEDVEQALQEFVFNLNVPTRVGFQTPFTNITMDLECPKMYEKDAVIIGGEAQGTTYADYQEEMLIINSCFLKVMTDGDARGRVFTFPVPTYNITEDFDWDRPGLEPLWEATAKYGIPYFANFVNSDMSPDDARSMCCRLRLDTRELEKRGGGLFGANPLTGSIGVVTVNLPRIGYESKNEEEFMVRLDELMDAARDSLEIKRKLLERLTDQGLYPFTTYYLRQVKERYGCYWFNHFSTVGLVGMNEACLNLIGEDISTELGWGFSARVLDHMRDRLQQFQEETGQHYNLEATPAEGTAYRLALRDKKRYPDCICANEVDWQNGAEPYYTNSSHVPVDHTEDIFEVLDHQDQLQTRYTGGTVVHVFVGEEINDPNAAKQFVRTACENYHIPYFTVTPTFSVCGSHGYQAGTHYECPTCGEASEVYSRVVGYIRPVQQWNGGKQTEFADRNEYCIHESASV